jgi:uncharacterized protein (TIGR00255 family)
MTGFGDAHRSENGVAYAVELRSLNNRYLKVTVRLPEELLGLEPELESAVRQQVSRGSVTLTVHFKDTSAAAAYEINEAALRRYLSHLETVERQAQADLRERGGVRLDLGSLLALPGIVQPPDQQGLLDRARPVLHELIDQACGKLLSMREAEGEGLAEDLLRHCGAIRERLDGIETRAPHVVEEYHQKLRDRINELLARAQLETDQVDLVREVALYAERCDISEEVQRLRAHLDQFEGMVKAPPDEAVGRRLDFVVQEMLREANTIGSKANDAQISQTVVEVKGSIDRMKEQVQNVE